ncbi:hypothetical protein [Geobacter sp. AOG2]|uniref:hypothetical protein n=1 Tax=Geobacter sp. AOG2 TaxID=1566347 RepID=UPI001CC7A819|nr:hypothetical protein [Geobacter sp. AOG2]GFE61929.1 hypothetical protein AOG2_25170 [Geobacter sp. AOG2]
MHDIQLNTATSIMVRMIDSMDHVSGLTGLAPEVSVSKNGGGFAAISPVVTERGLGWYNIDLAAADCDTPGELVVMAQAVGADPGISILYVVEYLSASISEVSICNMALARCGVTLFMESATEASQQASVCNLFYVPVRDRVLQAWPWQFARKYVLLQELGSPPSCWQYRYHYPSDCLKVRRLVRAGERGQAVGAPVPFEIGEAEASAARAILTDLPGAEAEYTARITDVALFPPSFASALAWALAAEIAIPLTTDLNRAQLAQRMYAQALLEAGADALNEGRTGDEAESDFIKARR